MRVDMLALFLSRSRMGLWVRAVNQDRAMAAAVGINVGSTMSLELCMFDKPVINVGYNPVGIDIHPVDIPRYYFFDHYRPIVESRATMLAHSEDEMRQLLEQTLNNPDITAVEAIEKKTRLAIPPPPPAART
jgi:hypothetical protein